MAILGQVERYCRAGASWPIGCAPPDADLAQLVEHLICNQGVTGSSPVIGTRIQKDMAPMDVKDSNGTVLKDGDSVILIKDLKVKGAGTTLKRGTKISSIRLTDNEEEVDCRHDKIKGLVLRVEFLKKA